MTCLSHLNPVLFHVRLHIWDLSAGDIFPVLTIEAGGLVGGRLCAFHISPTKIPSLQPLHSVSFVHTSLCWPFLFADVISAVDLVLDTYHFTIKLYLFISSDNLSISRSVFTIKLWNI